MSTTVDRVLLSIRPVIMHMTTAVGLFSQDSAVCKTLDHFQRVKVDHFGSAIPFLVGEYPLPRLWVFEVANEVRVSKGPQLDLRTCPTQLFREIRRKRGTDLASITLISRINCRCNSCRTVVSENKNRTRWLLLLQGRNLQIKPRQIGGVGVAMIVYSPIFDITEIRDEHLDWHDLLWQDF